MYFTNVRYFSFAHYRILNVCALSRDTTKIVFLFFQNGIRNCILD